MSTELAQSLSAKADGADQPASVNAADDPVLERRLLACLLWDNQQFDAIWSILPEQAFREPAHMIIYAIIGELINATYRADVTTVYEKAVQRSQAQEVGGYSYLTLLGAEAVDAGMARQYAKLLLERYRYRMIFDLGAQLQSKALQPEGHNSIEVLDAADRVMTKIRGEDTDKKSFFTSNELVVQVLDHVQEASERGDSLTGIPTGFIDLDKMTSGLQEGDLIVLAARPSMGKTSLAINIAENVGLNLGLPVCVFSLEMGAGQLMTRIMSSTARIPGDHLRTGRLSDDEWGRLSEAVEKLAHVDLVIDEAADSVPALRNRAKACLKQHGRLGLIVVDYLQLFNLGNVGEANRATAIGDVTRGLKLLAKELKCPMILLSQLNRAVETRTDKRPLMSDLRESGAIEQDADVIMFIYRDDYYNKDSKEPGIAELIISKQRNGPTGTVRLGFEKQITKFNSLTL